MGKFKIQLQLSDNTWSTRYEISDFDRFSSSSTQWRLVNSNFNIENYGIKLLQDQVDTTQTDICFSIIMLTNSVFKNESCKLFKRLI